MAWFIIIQKTYIRNVIFFLDVFNWYLISLNLFYETISCEGRHNVLLLIKYLILYKVKRKCIFSRSLVQSKKLCCQIIYYWKKFQPIVVQFSWKMCSCTFYNLIEKIVWQNASKSFVYFIWIWKWNEQNSIEVFPLFLFSSQHCEKTVHTSYYGIFP